MNLHTQPRVESFRTRPGDQVRELVTAYSIERVGRASPVRGCIAKATTELIREYLERDTLLRIAEAPTPDNGETVLKLTAVTTSGTVPDVTVHLGRWLRGKAGMELPCLFPSVPAATKKTPSNQTRKSQKQQPKKKKKTTTTDEQQWTLPTRITPETIICIRDVDRLAPGLLFVLTSVACLVLTVDGSRTRVVDAFATAIDICNVLSWGTNVGMKRTAMAGVLRRAGCAPAKESDEWPAINSPPGPQDTVLWAYGRRWACQVLQRVLTSGRVLMVRDTPFVDMDEAIITALSWWTWDDGARPGAKLAPCRQTATACSRELKRFEVVAVDAHGNMFFGRRVRRPDGWYVNIEVMPFCTNKPFTTTFTPVGTAAASKEPPGLFNLGKGGTVAFSLYEGKDPMFIMVLTFNEDGSWSPSSDTPPDLTIDVIRCDFHLAMPKHIPIRKHMCFDSPTLGRDVMRLPDGTICIDDITLLLTYRRVAASKEQVQYDKDVIAGCPREVVRRHLGFVCYRAEPVSQTTVDLSGATRSPDGNVVVKYFTIPSDV
jgi:hypothetical protein